MRGALAVTDDLRALTGDVMRQDPELFQTLRNFCGPPISEEDLWTLVGGPKFKRVPDDYADDTAKVSNGPKNGWKRVNREIGGKAETWRHHFGTQVITAAALSGVFDLACVASAQNNQNVTIFWEHDLVPLSKFVKT